MPLTVAAAGGDGADALPLPVVGTEIDRVKVLSSYVD